MFNRRFLNNRVLRNPEDGEGNQLPGTGANEGGQQDTPTIESLQEKLNSILEENEKIKSKNSELLNEAKTAKQKARERQEAADKAAEENARKSGDIESLDKSWQEKLSKRETELLSQIEKYQANARKTTVESTAMKVASEISTSPEVILPHILKRLDMKENEDGSFKTIVKDAAGNLSALTVEELANEFKQNEKFQLIIVGTKASGGGANGGNGNSTTKQGNAEARKARVRAALNK